MDRTQILGVKHMTLQCDLDLGSAIRVIYSAHCLTERMKINENRLKSLRDVERTRNSRVNPSTLTCGHNLESK